MKVLNPDHPESWVLVPCEPEVRRMILGDWEHRPAKPVSRLIQLNVVWNWCRIRSTGADVSGRLTWPNFPKRVA